MEGGEDSHSGLVNMIIDKVALLSTVMKLSVRLFDARGQIGTSDSAAGDASVIKKAYRNAIKARNRSNASTRFNSKSSRNLMIVTLAFSHAALGLKIHLFDIPGQEYNTGKEGTDWIIKL